MLGTSGPWDGETVNRKAPDGAHIPVGIGRQQITSMPGNYRETQVLCREMRSGGRMLSPEAGVGPSGLRFSERVTLMLKLLKKEDTGEAKAVVLDLGNFVPQGPFGNVWGHFWLSQLGMVATAT